MDSNKKKNSVRYKCQVRDINKKACLTRLQPDIADKPQMQVKRMLNGRCASVQRAAEHPPVVRRTAPSNMRIKLTAKLKSLSAFSLLAAYPPPVRLTRLKAGGCGTDL